MTAYRETERVCACCGTTKTFLALASTSAFGSPDLDLRPPPPARHTLGESIEECSNCGYCAPDVSAMHGAAQEIVKTAEYRALTPPSLAGLQHFLSLLRG